MVVPVFVAPQRVRATFALLVFAALLSQAFGADPTHVGKSAHDWVYVGTYNQRGSKGIYRLELDLSSGKLSAPALAGAARDPSYLAIHPNQRFLYAVNEVGELAGKQSGGVSSFAIDPARGDLTPLNQQASGGAGPCFLTLDSKGAHVLVANYGGGSASVLPIAADGRLDAATSFVQHRGRGGNPQRQEGPHAHSINLDAANHFAFVADLGLDQVLSYRYDATRGTLLPNDPPSFALPSGSGPRHFAFHPDGRHAYVVNEMGSTVTAFDYDPAHGSLSSVQTVSTLPRGYAGASTGADVQVHRSGKFLYASNRGHDSIAIFAIEPRTGKLSPLGHQGAHIKTPRGFGMDPAGMFLLVANQDSDSLVVFRINPETGKLLPTGTEVKVPMPVCVKIMPRPR